MTESVTLRNPLLLQTQSCDHGELFCRVASVLISTTDCKCSTRFLFALRMSNHWLAAVAYCPLINLSNWRDRAYISLDKARARRTSHSLAVKLYLCRPSESSVKSSASINVKAEPKCSYKLPFPSQRDPPLLRSSSWASSTSDSALLGSQALVDSPA